MHNDYNDYTPNTGRNLILFCSSDLHTAQELVNLSHTSEFLLLLLSHPVDGEAGFSSQSPPQDSLVGLSLHVSNGAGALCGDGVKTSDTF